MIALYAAGGGVEFVIQAWLLCYCGMLRLPAEREQRDSNPRPPA
jgi:hypothetical protein